MFKRSTHALLPLCGVCALFFMLSAQAAEPGDETTERLSRLGLVEQGKKAPWLAGFDVFRPTHAHNLSKFLSRPGTKRLAIVFFATWCVPCRKGLALLAENKARLEQAGVGVVLVDVREKTEVVAPFLRKMKLEGFDAIIDKFGVHAKSYGLLVETKDGESVAVPKTFVLGQNGVVIAIFGKEGKDYVDQIIEVN